MSEKRVTVQKVGAVLKKAGFTPMRHEQVPHQPAVKVVAGYKVRTYTRQAVRIWFVDSTVTLSATKQKWLERYGTALDAAGLVFTRDYFLAGEPCLIVTGYKGTYRGKPTRTR